MRKLQDRIASSGILISLSGITLKADGITNAHSEVLNALTKDGIRILFIKRENILLFKTTTD